MNVIVTGASGFIGSSLASGLAKKDFQLTAITNKKICDLPSANVANVVTPIDVDSMSLVLKSCPDVFVHCVGSPSVSFSQKNPMADYLSTVETTIASLEAIRLTSPETLFILFSSAAVYGERNNHTLSEDMVPKPISVYGYNKHLAELLVQQYASQYSLNALILRPFSVYGEKLKKQVIFDLSRKLISAQDVIEVAGTGREVRDFLHIDDLVSFVSELIKMNTTGVLNVGTGVSTSLKGLVQSIASVIAPDVKIHFTGEKTLLNPQSLVSNVTKLNSLGLNPHVGVSAGIEKVCRYIVSQAGSDE